VKKGTAVERRWGCKQRPGFTKGLAQNAYRHIGALKSFFRGVICFKRGFA